MGYMKSFQVCYNEVEGIIESRVRCPFDWNFIEAIAPEIAKLILEKNCELLFLDFRRSNVNMSTVKIYETPKKIAFEFCKLGIDAWKLKRALLINPGQRDFDFFKNVTTNSAQILELFTDEENAKKWLTSRVVNKALAAS
jgi:hypothetical protein